jgi:hypothetical protein
VVSSPEAWPLPRLGDDELATIAALDPSILGKVDEDDVAAVR